MILKRLVVGPFASNCYIVGAESNKEGIVIDPGEDARKIINTIKELGLEVKLIVLTHGHIDHIQAVGKVKEATGAAVAVHPDDAGLLKQQPAGLGYGLKIPSINPDRLLKGGESLTCGDLKFLVIHTPGHSPGCICLLGHGVLFSGDTLFNMGIGRYDLQGGDYHSIMDSLNGKLMVLPGETIVYPGHGPETTIAEERQGNPFLRE